MLSYKGLFYTMVALLIVQQLYYLDMSSEAHEKLQALCSQHRIDATECRVD